MKQANPKPVPSLTRQLAGRLRNRLITAADVHTATYYTLDVLGSYMAGGVTPQGRKLIDYHRINRLQGVESEVFLAAALSHITETDDLHRSSVTHPACVVVPAALEMARHLDLTGKMALEAVVVGYEAMIRIGDALGDAHYQIFHNTATAGVFGSAAAAAYLLELSEDQWVWALGNAGTQGAGLWQFNVDATMSKHLHAGHAAQAGVRAALLAARGFTGPEHILEGEKGFFKALCPDARPEAVLADAAGWRIGETSVKPYPSCRHTHPAIDVALQLRKELEDRGLSPDEVEHVRIRTYATAQRVTDNPAPDTTFAAKFSIQFCVVSALRHGFPVLPDFEGDRLTGTARDPRVQRAEVISDATFTARYPKAWGSSLELTLRSGEVLSAETFAAKGDPEKSLDWNELKSKIRGEFAYAGIDETTAASQIQAIEELGRAEVIPNWHWNRPAAVAH